MVGGPNKQHLKRLILDMARPTNTEEIVKDYIGTCLRRSGYGNEWRDEYPTPDPTPAMETMRVLGERFEHSYFNSFNNNMMEDFDITSADAEQKFNSVAQVLFSNGVQWGRIIGLLVFASKLSLKVIEPSVARRDLVDSIASWTCSILLSPFINDWILENNGWDGFVEFYRNPQNGAIENGGFGGWKELIVTGVATVAGAAAVLNFFRR